MTMTLACLLAAALTVNPVADPDVLEPSVLNEVEHALSRGEVAATRAAPAWTEDRAALLKTLRGLNRTDAAIRLVSTQRADGAWRLGTNDVTRAALDALRSLAGIPRPVARQVPAREVNVRQGIGHVLRKIADGKKEIVVAYLGGSITEMTGWRNLTTDWLCKTYPDVTFREVPASIGGTGSSLGVFRVGHDALAHSPDLLFVEFATNDSRQKPEEIWRSMEGIVRQTWRKDPTTDIVFTYTITAFMMDDYGRGLFPQAACAMEQLADFYGIPSIGFGPRVAAEVKAGRLVMSLKAAEKAAAGTLVFAQDGVHPGLPGHGFYLMSVTNAWAQMKGIPPADHAAKMAVPFVGNNLEAAKMIAIEPDMVSGSWRRFDDADAKQRRFGARMGQIWQAETPGDALSFTFSGTTCKIYDLLGPDGGQVWITVDGQRSAGPVPRFDSYCTNHRIATLGVFDGAEGVHTVRIEVDRNQPSRQSVAFRLKDPEKELAAPKYQGTRFWPAQIMLVGDIVRTK